jgi:hypothetical protein
VRGALFTANFHEACDEEECSEFSAGTTPCSTEATNGRVLRSCAVDDAVEEGDLLCVEVPCCSTGLCCDFAFSFSEAIGSEVFHSCEVDDAVVGEAGLCAGAPRCAEWLG